MYRPSDKYGRGIAIANLMSFDKLSYTNDGAKSIAKVFLHNY